MAVPQIRARYRSCDKVACHHYTQAVSVLVTFRFSASVNFQNIVSNASELSQANASRGFGKVPDAFFRSAKRDIRMPRSPASLNRENYTLVACITFVSGAILD